MTDFEKYLAGVDISKYYLITNTTEPFPIQRMNWLSRIFPETKNVFNSLKTVLAKENYLAQLTTMDITDKVLAPFVTKDKEKYVGTVIDELSWKGLIHTAVYNMTFMYNWNLYKQIYKFDIDTLDMLLNAADITTIPANVLSKNLPYPAFYIDNKFSSKYSDVSYRGCFVTILNINNKLELGLFFIEDSEYSDYHYCFVPLYFDNVPIAECIQKRDELYNVRSEEKEVSLMSDLINQALKAIIYICSVNKEIETIKVTVNSNSTNSKKSKNKKTKKINQNYVGYKLGNTIRQKRKQYIYVDENDNTVDVKSKAMRKSPSPHMRMAHYHHYWTGKMNDPENRKLIVKFIPPLYIGNNHNVLSTVHKVKT
jgi:hypothetical protein